MIHIDLLPSYSLIIGSNTTDSKKNLKKANDNITVHEMGSKFVGQEPNFMSENTGKLRV